MSKSDGLKIGIKFTEDLVGDVSGNESAFTITGQEYKYVNGPLIDGNYLVDKVERYPVQRVWELGGELQLDGPGEMAITDSKCYETTSGTTLTGTVNANAGDIVLATISHRSAFTAPDGWTKLYESIAVNSSFKQKMVFVIKKIESTGLVSFTATQSTTGRIYLNLISISGISNIENTDYEAISTVATMSISVPNKTEWERLVWGCTSPLWTLSNYKHWVTSPDDLELISLPNTTAARQANFIDDGNGMAIGRSFAPDAGTSGSEVIVKAVKLTQEYTASKIAILEPIVVNGEYRLKWLESKPESTDILMEYTTGETQGQWQEVSNDAVINIDTNLWIKVILSTEDETATPILEDLWLEEASAPQDKILISMDWWGKFNNAHDKIKVLYDASKGSLSGAGGAVDSFEVEFTPQDLVQTPNPNVEETIKAYPYEVVLDLKEVTFNNVYPQETVKAYPYSIVLTLTDIGEINP